MTDTILLLTYMNFVISIFKKVAFHYIRPQPVDQWELLYTAFEWC